MASVDSLGKSAPVLLLLSSGNGEPVPIFIRGNANRQMPLHRLFDQAEQILPRGRRRHRHREPLLSLPSQAYTMYALTYISIARLGASLLNLSLIVCVMHEPRKIGAVLTIQNKKRPLFYSFTSFRPRSDYLSRDHYRLYGYLSVLWHLLRRRITCQLIPPLR